MRLRWLIQTVCGLLAAMLSLAACTPPSAPSTKIPLALVRFRAEAASFLTFSGYDQPQSLVVHDRDTWLRTWNDVHRRITPTPPLPDVDFSTDMVVMAALGSRPSSGFDVLFTSASEADGVMTVEVESRSPGPRCVTLTVITSPLDLARVPRRNGAVVFHTTPTVIDCP